VPDEPLTDSLVGWPVPPRGGVTIDEWHAINRFRSDAKLARYRRDILPVNVVLREAWADE
jgi:hypothetical protein